MANEILLTAKLSFSKGGKSASQALSAGQFTMNGTDYAEGTQTIGTTAEALFKGEVTTPGLYWVKNVDTTNFIEIDKATFTTPGTIKIKAGEAQLIRFMSTAPFALANTAPVDIVFLMIED